jgi:hypothetical protein
MADETRRPIEGKVAKVLNARELALNIGSMDGVRRGMKFDVIDPKGEDIKDPNTGASLGSLGYVKVRLEVSRVAGEHLSLAETEGHTVNVGGNFQMGQVNYLSQMFLPPQYETRYPSLKTPPGGREEIDEEESFVKAGDPVVEAMEEEKPKVKTSASPAKFVDKLIGEEPSKSR